MGTEHVHFQRFFSERKGGDENDYKFVTSLNFGV